MEKPRVQNPEGISKLLKARSIANGLGLNFSFGVEVEDIPNTPEVNSLIEQASVMLHDLEKTRDACQLKLSDLGDAIFRPKGNQN